MLCTIHYHQCSNVNSKETQEKLGLTYDKLHDKSVASSLSATNEAHILKYRLLYVIIYILILDYLPTIILLFLLH